MAQSSAKPPTATELRKRIAKFDQDMLAALSERAATAKELAAVVGAAELSQVLNDEEALIKRIVGKNKGPLADAAVRAVFREVVSGCRALQRQPRVAFLGPEYSYSHQAVVERFGSTVDYAPVATIAAVFEEVNRGHATYGLVPVENSNDGRVVDTLEMFARMPTRICGEVRLHIHHQLLAKCPRDQITEVYSKPQAISQCRNWLAKHLPAAKTIEMTSTTAAAQLASQKEGAAAIASKAAGINYGLDAVVANIEDNPRNITRFAVISREIGPRTGNDKTSLLFQLEHQPGALADAMGIFKRNRLNLTWIESFPVAGADSEYLFFVEMEGHAKDLKVRKAITALEKKAMRLEVLGSCQKTEPIDG